MTAKEFLDINDLALKSVLPSYLEGNDILDMQVSLDDAV